MKPQIVPATSPLHFVRRAPEEMLARARAFYAELDARRTTRDFSSEPVARELIELAIRSASTAPSGAHKQPWQFVAVSDAALKAQMREAAEREERKNYASRMSAEWLQALAPLGTDEHKAHITDAPWVVVAFKKPYDLRPAGARSKNYYVDESVGIACGLFVTAIHHMGLVTLTHTPSPMDFLAKLLGRPENERAFLLMPVGYPAPEAQVPKLSRKSLEEVAEFR